MIHTLRRIFRIDPVAEARRDESRLSAQAQLLSLEQQFAQAEKELAAAQAGYDQWRREQEAPSVRLTGAIDRHRYLQMLVGNFRRTIRENPSPKGREILSQISQLQNLHYRYAAALMQNPARIADLERLKTSGQFHAPTVGPAIDDELTILRSELAEAQAHEAECWPEIDRLEGELARAN